MRLVFMGSPDFAVPSLEKLHSSCHQIVLVVTQPDRPRGRGLVVSPPPVKRKALSLGLPVLQPENLRAEEFIAALRAQKPDLGVVVGFRILPEEVFALPRLGSINLHASLLPSYRGAAPINWALIDGQTKTGLTTFRIAKQVDCGEILLQQEVEILPDDNFGTLSDRMARIGADLVLRTVDGLEAGLLQPRPQPSMGASKAPKITPDLGKINWQMEAQKIGCLVRGLSPRPGAYSHWHGRKVIILTARVLADSAAAMPGTVVKADPRLGIVVACGQGALELLQLKPEGRQMMSGAEFVRGYRVSDGDRFGN